MKLWLTMLTLGLGVGVSAVALEEPKTAESGQEESSSTDKPEERESESPILRLAELRIDEYVVPARMINLPLPGRTRTLQDVLDRFDAWTKDERIGGVLLDVGNVALSLPDVQELRVGIRRLQSSDKKVMAFLNAGTPQAYLLASAADEIATPPTGFVAVPGVGSLFPFMKGYFQMLGLEFEVLTAGRYKYPGFLNRREPDQYFLEEFGTILDSWISDYRRMIAARSSISEDKAQEIIDTALFDATDARNRGLVDVLAYFDDYRDRVLSAQKMRRWRTDERSLAQVNSIQGLMELINEELRRAEKARKTVGPKIAVLHARGPIVDFNLGIGFASQLICRDDFVKVVDELRRNRSIRAVVMRVDSPGGSGYASDVIWKELRRLNDEKPLVVSMGSVAGSGGYYIASPARRIFAQPTTLTGSIGVLGIFQLAQSRFNRMDYELVPMSRGRRALLGAPHQELRPADRAFIQKYIDDFYEIFLDRVAMTRKMPVSEVRKVAQGRIYTGRQALELHLVDELGGLDQAVQAARSMANIPPSAELQIVHYPRAGSLGEIFESFSAVGMTEMIEVLAQGLNGTFPIPFEQQLILLTSPTTGSYLPQPLTWLAVPDFYAARPAVDHIGRQVLAPAGRRPSGTVDPLREVQRHRP